MATFWAIVIGAIFVVAVIGLLLLGGRYLRAQKHAHDGETFESSRDTRARDRRDEQLNRNRETDSSHSDDRGGNVRVYRH